MYWNNVTKMEFLYVHFWNKRIYTMLWPAWHRQHTPNSKNARIVHFPLNAHNLQLDVLCFTNNYPSSHLLITNTCFSQSYKASPLQRLLFWSCSPLMFFSLRRLNRHFVSLSFFLFSSVPFWWISVPYSECRVTFSFSNLKGFSEFKDDFIFCCKVVFAYYLKINNNRNESIDCRVRS